MALYAHLIIVLYYTFYSIYTVHFDYRLVLSVIKRRVIMDNPLELQELTRCLEERVCQLERCLVEKNELIENLTSKLDQYQSVVHIASAAAAGGRRKQRAHGISAEPQQGRLSLQHLPKNIIISPKSQRSVM